MDIVNMTSTQLSAIINTFDLNIIIPNLFSVLVFVLLSVIGYFVAKFIGGLWRHASKHMDLEGMLKEHGIHNALLGWTLTGVIKLIIELWLFLLFVGWASHMANFDFLTENIQGVIAYLPDLVKGLAIIVIALLFGDYVTNTIKRSRTPFSKTIGLVLEVVIAYIGVVIALPLILPGASTFLLEQTFMTGVNALFATVTIALGFGGAIAIGLGSKDSVRNIVKKKEKEIEKII